MTDSVRSAVIQKLNSENYSIWSFKVKLLLMKDKLWDVVTKPKPTTIDEAWTAKDHAAQVTIGLFVEDSQLRLFQYLPTAKEQWDTIKGYHQKSTLSAKMSLIKRLYHTELEEGGDMVEHIATLSEYVDRLAGIGKTFDDDTLVGIFLCSIPASYSTLIMALESRPEKDITSDFVKGKLIDEYMRRKDLEKRSKSAIEDTAMKTVYKNEDDKKGSSNASKCFFCKKPGHAKKDCFKYKKWKENKEKADKEKANKVSVEVYENTDDYGCYLARAEVCLHTQYQQKGWIIDSGATSHMAQHQSFLNCLDYSKQGHIRLADDKKRIKVEAVGSAAIKCTDVSGKPCEIKVNNVLYAPGLGSNLLSVVKLAQEGYKLEFEKDICRITKNGEVFTTVKATSHLYELRGEKACVARESLNKGCSTNCHHVWHRRFGHRYTSAIKELAEKQLATGIQISDCKRNALCESCVQGKMARTPFPKESETMTCAALDMIHTDVCGPMQTQTPGNKRYFMSVIDDYSRYAYLYLMTHKDEAAGFIKDFVKMTKTQFGKVPKIIRSDRGGEYVNKDLQTFLKKEGIRVQYTAPRSPQQNGVAERKNRSLLDMSRCMLFDADLDKKYWGEAVTTAIYLQNRLPSRATTKTPFELWYQVKPDLRNLQIFGSPAFVHIPKEERKKLDMRAEKLIFVGYSEESKAYRLLNTTTNRIKISRDVVFLDKRCIKEKIPAVEEISHADECEVIWNNSHLQLEDQQNESSSIESSDEEEAEEEDYQDITSSTDYESSSSQNEDVPNEMVLRENRRSERSNKGVPPNRYEASLHLTVEESEPRNVKEALSRPDKDSWKNAMDDEINSLKKNGTWEIVPRPDGRDIVTCKWVFKTKRNADGQVERHKARLVARGFSQKYGTDYDEVFAPVVKQTTFRTLLTVAGHTGMHVQHFDAKTAFLNGELKETIYMQQPDGYIIKDGKEMVCRLRKGIYGLKQAAKVWNDRLNDCLSECNFIQSKSDLCLYVRKEGNELIYLIVYVDDFLIAAKDTKKIAEIAKFLSTKFKLKDLGIIKYYLGIEIRRDENGIFRIKQSGYIEKILHRFGLQDAKDSKIPLDQGYTKTRIDESIMPQSEKYQKLIGALLYISVNTRPDITASVTILSQHNKAPTTVDWNEAKRVARYLKGTKDIELRLGNKSSAPTLIGYADADWAENRLDRKSNSGYLFQYCGSPINWACRKQQCVSLSSTEAEYVALAEATQEGVWIRRLLEDFEGRPQEKIIMYEDNQSCLKLLDHKKFSHRTKHIDTKYHFIKDIKDKKIMEYRYCPTSEMIADMLTKPLGKIKLKDFAELSGLTNN